MTTLLFVEDEESIRQIYAQRLREEGYDVYVAVDGKDGLEKARKHCPNLIISDITMPNMNGINFFLELQKSDAELAAIPFIFLTAKSSDKNKVAGMRLGVDGYLTKPVKFEILSATIESSLKSRKRHTDLLRSKLVSLFQPLVENDEYRVGEYQSLETLFDHYNQIAKTVIKPNININLLREASFSVKTLEEAKEVSHILSSICPEPETAIIGIIELLVNGIEHGNLDIGYQLKTKLLKEGRWIEEIECRQKHIENSAKYVDVIFKRTDKELKFKFTDCGKGFLPNVYFDFNPRRSHDLHGRGIAIANAVGFDELKYEGNGNKVVATIKVS